MKFVLSLLLCFSVSFALPKLSEREAPLSRGVNAFLKTRAQCGSSSYRVSGDKIVGGRPANAGEFPWQISLQYNGWFGKSHMCGGSILTERTIITAAHCVDGDSPSDLSIRYGSLKHASGGTEIEIEKIIVHPNYDSYTIDNDIAILHTKVPIVLGTDAGTVCLPSQGSDPSGDTTVSGWGTIQEGGSSPADLMAVDVPIVDRETCRGQYGATEISDYMICAGIDAGGKDACQGDSGGPLIQRDGSGVATLAGIVSWGYGCARPSHAGVYTRVGTYVDNFIKDNTI